MLCSMLKSSSSQKFEFPVFHLEKCCRHVSCSDLPFFNLMILCLTMKKINFKQKSVFSSKISPPLFKQRSTNKKRLFSLKISLTKKKKRKLQTKQPFFVKDKFHQEESQQTKKPFFVNDKSHQERTQLQTKKSCFR